MSVAHASWPPVSPASRVKVLVADDSVVVRGLIARWLEESGIEVVATVSNGRAALEALARTDPDIVLLDLDMPELDGISTLPLLLEKRPGLSVIIVSTLTRRNAEISFQCLSLGATDYLPKPESNRQVTTSPTFRSELVAKVQALARPRRRPGAGERKTEPAGTLAEKPTPASIRLRAHAMPLAPRCLLLGASTGGPKALADVLCGLPDAIRRLPTLIVQHMPPVFTRAFAEHLSAQIAAPAREALDGEPILPGRVYIAPGGCHLGLACDNARQALVRLDEGPLVNFCRPSVDVLFRDAAGVFGASALAIVLTGMGSDGLNGARALVAAGAPVIVQDEATSTVWGMPGQIARAGLAREVLPIEAIAPAIRKMLGSAP